MKRLLIGLWSFLLLSCAQVTTKPFTAEELSSPARSLTVTNREGGMFLVDYVNPGTGQVIDNFALSELTGRSMILVHHLKQPRDLIQADLTKMVAKQLNVVLFPSADKISFYSDDETVDQLLEVYDYADLVLDVTTPHWALVFNKGQYQMQLTASARLIERATGKVVGASYCSPHDIAGAYAEEQLTVNRAQILKQEIKSLAATCTDELFNGLF